mmetsp:Transcript_770/g.1055  ORF Transcript_770/g.1055 Transcript_770/m.1055 type:complete len:90 (-) Transcript_770:801-1070(-)
MPMHARLDIGVFKSIKPSFSANCCRKFPCAGRSNEQSSSSTQAKKCIEGEAMRETRGAQLNAKKRSELLDLGTLRLTLLLLIDVMYLFA